MYTRDLPLGSRFPNYKDEDSSLMQNQTTMEKMPRKGLDAEHISGELSRHQLNLTLDEGRPCINRNARVRT